MTSGARQVRVAIQVLCGIALVIAGAFLPWATYTNLATGVTTPFRGGPLSICVILAGSATITLALGSLLTPSARLAWTQVAVAGSALVLCVWLYLTKISAANSVTLGAPGSGVRTAGGSGTPLALGAAVILVVTTILRAHQPTPGQPLAHQLHQTR